MVKVRFYASLRQEVGKKSDLFPMNVDRSLSQLLANIAERYPALRQDLFDADGQIHGYIRIFINKQDASYRKDLGNISLKESDIIDIFPAIGGGEF